MNSATNCDPDRTAFPPLLIPHAMPTSLKSKPSRPPVEESTEIVPALKTWKPAQLRRMRDFLRVWYETAARDLPWRRTRDPYAIAVSEFMLQQTQVVTVLPYYARWMKQFPDWATLAGAKEETVIKAWEGLGYYRRARNLQALAQAVVAIHGELPRDFAGLLALPGIGPYTAAAIGSISFDLPLAVLDGNVMRVLTRLLALRDDIALPKTRAKLQLVADGFLDRRDPATHNQAVMELGATICVPRKPLCLLCPLKRDCLGKDRAEEFPVKTRIATVKRVETVAILQHGDRFYCEQVREGMPWQGLWRFPDFDPARMIEGEEIATIRYGITKYAVTMRVVSARWIKRAPIAPSVRYLTREEMEAFAFAAPHRKVMTKLPASNSREA
jgi:A/G-specific adenine glycosylase